MSLRRTDGASIIQALAMTVAEIPVFLYSTFGQSIFSQLRLSPGLKKVLFATALGTVALALTAHQLKRRGRRKKQDAEKRAESRIPALGKLPPFKRATPPKRVQSPGSKSNDTLSAISSSVLSRRSSSSHSLTSVRPANSPNPQGLPAEPWEAGTVQEENETAEDSNAENLYIIGMELFEEALQKWELALIKRQKSGSETEMKNCLMNLGASGGIGDSCEPSRNKEFSQKLEALLHRAYRLQEEFGETMPSNSVLADFECVGALALPFGEDAGRYYLDDDASVTSEDSFFSAAELFDSLSFDEERYQLSRSSVLYEEAMRIVQDDRVACRSFRTEVLECYSDEDFLAKLHCVRQAFEVLLQDETNRLYFSEIGKQMITGLMSTAGKNVNRFHETYQEMLHYAAREETWATTKRELEGRGVVCMSFFDIVLDFILMDAFEDLESPPSSVVAVLRNRWLSDSFKETALATACWSVLKAKRRLLQVPDGFISHFYSISEHVSPVLAWGFLGPKQHLCEVCTIFKQQILQYLKDMFDLDKVRYTTVNVLADDIVQLSRRRSEILLGYLGVDAIPEMNGTIPTDNGPLEEASLV
ncbi:mitoguardin 2 isoform X1 [Scyliorhinus canicula]|uniref:mitoguardin 2 isoform X1 n=1 Tax=Scyliorhinus canicula TaxID=7830 RepID=UPI0018F34E87|nr:mitoguardin 2 isoform X1 [Scyliorhinus canicula]XP_038637571.1 mitoguardin 2 isoform X1 [Scyliorhinus canicula]XP_038637572.1 mitoguardin 2 isoform X1 [Scyliorhinus canicula]XP_038637573.1 mitoguardin 2 isoform X1 [Scyliorhinus canicula]